MDWAYLDEVPRISTILVTRYSVHNAIPVKLAPCMLALIISPSQTITLHAQMYKNEVYFPVNLVHISTKHNK